MKSTLFYMSMVLLLPLVASASLSERHVFVLKGQCVSTDQRYSAEINGTTVIQRKYFLFDGAVRSDLLNIHLKNIALNRGVDLVAVDGQSDNLTYEMSSDAARLNIAYINADNKTVELEMACTSEVNEKAMKGFQRRTR